MQIVDHPTLYNDPTILGPGNLRPGNLYVVVESENSVSPVVGQVVLAAATSGGRVFLQHIANNSPWAGWDDTNHCRFRALRPGETVTITGK